MTLVVARKFGAAIYVVSDTLVSFDRTNKKTELPDHRVKSRVFDGAVCVSFAGNTSFADEAIKSFAKTSERDIAFTLSHFERWHRVSDALTDFIIAFHDPAPQLFVVKGGEVAETTGAWIGSHKGFEEFQTSYLSRQSQPTGPMGAATIDAIQLPEADGSDHESYVRMLAAMSSTISNCGDVGGLLVSVATHRGRLQFMSHMQVVSHPLDQKSSIPNTWNAVPFGTAEEGGCAICITASSEPVGELLSAYFLQGRFGLIFRPSEDGILEPNLFRDVSPLDYEEAVQGALGVAVKTFFSGVAAYVSRSSKRFREKRFEAALDDINKAIELEPRNGRFFHMRSLCHGFLGADDAALRDMNRAIELGFTEYPSFYNRGLLLARIGKVQNALSDFSKAIELRPTAEAFSARSQAYLNLGFHELATADAARAHSAKLPQVQRAVVES